MNTEKTARNIFPLATAATSDAEMLAYLKNPEIAMGFALEHLQDWELREFFQDWKDDADMTPWLSEWRKGQDAAKGIKSASSGEAVRVADPVEISAFADEDILSFLTDPEAAIAFALDHLEPFEVAEFLRERREGKPLLPWIKAWREDRAAA